jgi:cytochrome o ubiquinol oxidase subunit 2
VGKSERLLLFDASAIMLAIGIPVILLTLVFAWWFRAGNRHARYRPDWEYSGRIELIVWAIPMLVILFLGGMAWVSSHELDPPRTLQSRSPPVEVQVVSLDWQWLFIYPAQGVASVNHLVVPAGVPIRFSLTSATVMNSFFIPQLGSQIYSMPGMTTHLNLQADQKGTYHGLSAQFSGDGFSDMRFELDAVSDAEFESWISASRAKGGVLDSPAFIGLAHPSRDQGSATYGNVSEGLFDAVASGHIAAETGAHREP